MRQLQRRLRLTYPFVGLTLIFAVLAIGVSLANPLYESTDEIRHYRYVRIVATEHRLPIQDQEQNRAQSHHPPLYYVTSALLTGWLPSPHDGDFQHPGNPFWGYRSFAPGVDNKLQYWHGPAEPFHGGHSAALAARWVNVLFGIATLVVTHALALQVFGTRKSTKVDSQGLQTSASPQLLALAATAIVALNPQFIYLSGAINNDIVAALAGASLILVSVRLIRTGITPGAVISVGVISGLALLAKLQIAALGPVVALAVVIAVRRARPMRPWPIPALRLILIVGAIAMLISGWWFIRNVRLYGEPTGMQRLSKMWGGRDALDNLWAIGQGLPQLWASLWGQFGYGQIPLPNTMYRLALIGTLLCLSGLLKPRKQLPSSATLALLVAAICLCSIVVAYYMAANPAGAMGRFLFPVLPPFAILVVLGLQQWFGDAGRTAGTLLTGMALFSAVALFGYLWPAVTYPRQQTRVSTHHEPVATIGDIAEVMSVEVETPEAGPGEPVWVRVNWRPLRWSEEPLVFFVHLIDEAGIVVAQRDTWPGVSRAPTTSWRADHPFVDHVRVDLPRTLYTPNTLEVRIGLYGPTLGRLPVLPAEAAATDSWTIGTVRVPAPAGAWPNPVDVNFEHQIRLVGYELSPRVVRPGETITLSTIWHVSDALSGTPYLFAQVLDSEWHVWGSRDGGHPEWRTGIVTDTREITLIPETPEGSYPVNVGLVGDEGRLDVIGDAGMPAGDFISLGPIGVR